MARIERFSPFIPRVAMFVSSVRRMTRDRRFVRLLLLVAPLVASMDVDSVHAQQPLPPLKVAPPLCGGESPDDQRKSPGLALALSAGGTAIPSFAAGFLMDTRAGPPLVGVGTAIGPSLGNYYAENCRRAAKGLKIRAAGITIVAEGLVIGLAAPFSESIRTVVRVLIGAGVATVAVGAIYEIATAPVSAKEYNRSHDVRARIAPAVDSHGEQVGLALRVRL